MNWLIGIESVDERLDKFLTARMPGSSRSAIQKMIKEGFATVNGKNVAVHHFLREGEKIEVAEKKRKIEKISKKKGKLPSLDIVYEDDDLLVVNKPSGLLVHEVANEKGPTLADALLAYYPKLNGVGEDALRPGMVHRLDKDVSGIIVIAKTQKVFEFLKELFKNRTIKKEYLGLVYGSLPLPSDRITFRIARSKRRARMAARSESQEGREAITEYEVVNYYANATFVKISIETGRTHQIRAHFHAYGHPIVGDPLYKIKGLKIRPELARPFLHAAKISFTDWNGHKREFSSPLPRELEEYVTKLKPTDRS